MSRVLIAGIGNVFQGDDGFGVAVAERLAKRDLPPDVRVADFGIRGVDLVYALLDGYHAAILVDSVQRGDPPGSLYVIEPETQPSGGEAMLSPHAMDPQSVLQLAAALGGLCKRILLVGCEPGSFGEDAFGSMELSPAVAAAVGPAADIAADLAARATREIAGEEQDHG